VIDRRGRLALVRVARELRRCGLLPFTDPAAPSLVSIVVGRPVAGSWWGHPAGMLIYQVGEALESDPDVLLLKLWCGKLTLVHRRLWSALVKVGTSRAPWQTVGLNRAGLALLGKIELEKTLRSDRLPPGFQLGSPAFRPALRDLERRLLVLTRSVHTSTGAHALEAESWESWKARVRAGRFGGSVDAAQLAFESAARGLTPERVPRRAFPWS